MPTSHGPCTYCQAHSRSATAPITLPSKLRRAVEDHGHDDVAEELDTPVAGKRLKDVSDPPLDLRV
ncbi:NgoMIV family type II restriction endonuclease [Olsenella uli]|uniref:NgoMIV family type II restriction endonuclease n=1 Tax=Olsenella uli TaxID=133926 RepID=UPI0011D05F0E